MNEKHAMRLNSNFPVLYRDKDRSKLESAMYWGFQCGDGWFQLIYDLSVAIEAKALELGLDPGREGWWQVRPAMALTWRFILEFALHLVLHAHTFHSVKQ